MSPFSSEESDRYRNPAVIDTEFQALQYSEKWTIKDEHNEPTYYTLVDSFGVMFDGTGRFSFQIISADRSKFASNNPRNPVGQAVAYFGTYTVDEAAKTLTYHIERATFPQWDGINRTANIAIATDNEFNQISASVQDPSLGTVIPHLNFKRAM